MNNFELNGLVVPVPTPFAADGKIDFGAFLAHRDWLAECGVRNLLVNGTTGEFSHGIKGVGGKCYAVFNSTIPLFQYSTIPLFQYSKGHQ